MAIPLKYNLRNLRVRWRLTLATTLGIALVVAVFVMVMALARGLKQTYVSTGDDRNLLVLRKGSTAESSSQVGREQVRIIRYLPGIAMDPRVPDAPVAPATSLSSRAGRGISVVSQAPGVTTEIPRQLGMTTAPPEPLVSAEIVVLINLDRVGSAGSANVLVRGLGPVGLALRPGVHLVEGRQLAPGRREALVSRKIADRFANCRVGETFRTGRTDWQVVGIFDAQKTAYESEIWVDADEARDVFKRNFYGSVLLRPVDDAAAAALTRMMEADKRLQVRVLPETAYYLEQTKTAGPIQFMGSFLAVIMSIGAAFSAMNTMYATVGSRTREIGTLRVLGFRRRDIYLCFLLESVLLALLGGAMGCLFSLPLNGVATGTFSWTSFAEVAFEFRITGELLAKGMVFALVMGVLGGLLPARLAARKPVLDALRAV